MKKETGQEVKRTCKDCEHMSQWTEYGVPMYDCFNKAAYDFMASLDGVTDPASAGCPFYKHYKQEKLSP